MGDLLKIWKALQPEKETKLAQIAIQTGLDLSELAQQGPRSRRFGESTKKLERS